MRKEIDSAVQNYLRAPLIAAVVLSVATFSSAAALSAEPELISKADPNQSSATAGALMTTQRCISDNGRYVVFDSGAENLVAGQIDDGGSNDIFLHDRVTGITVLVSHAAGAAATVANDSSMVPSISGNGQFVVYWSFATNIAAGQNETSTGTPDVFLYDRVTGANTLVSHLPGQPTTPGNSNSFDPAVSGDGRFVAFTSSASDLVTGQVDGGGGASIFLWDRLGDTITLVTHATGAPLTTSDGFSFNPVLNADGSFLVYQTNASNIVAGQSQDARRYQIFLWKRATGETKLVSHAAASATTATDGASFLAEMSADASYVTFYSAGTNLVTGQTDVNQTYDVFGYNPATGVVALISHAEGSATTTGAMVSLYPEISADGTTVVFQSSAPNLVANDLNNAEDIFVWSRATGLNTLASRSATPLLSASGNGRSYGGKISGDGKTITFTSFATDLIAGQSGGTLGNVFLFNATDGSRRLISHLPANPLAGGNNQSFLPLVSADGNVVAFNTQANDLVPNDNNGSGDVIIYDRATDTNAAASNRAAGLASQTPNGHSGTQSASSDGRYVVFTSEGTNLVANQADNNNANDVFVRDRQTGATILVSHAAGSPAAAADAISDSPKISGDGRWITYASRASDLVNGVVDLNGGADVFLYDRMNNATTLVSHSTLGAGFSASDVSQTPALSGDGRFVTYAQPARAGNGSSGEAPRYGYQSVSPDGRFVAFWSSSTNLIPDQVDQNGFNGDLFLFDRLTGGNVLLSHALGAPLLGGNNGSGDSQHTGGPIWSADGRSLFFASRASNLISDDFNNREDVFALHIDNPPIPAVVSRKTHGAAGPFDIDLPLSGTPGIECRNGGVNNQYRLVLTFAAPITFSSADVSSGIGSVSGTTINGNRITVNLTGVINKQTIIVTLFGATDGTNSGDLGIPMSVLVGDTTHNGAVNSSDISQTKSRSGQALSDSNFRSDVNLSGAINSSDIALVKSKSGTALAR